MATATRQEVGKLEKALEALALKTIKLKALFNPPKVKILRRKNEVSFKVYRRGNSRWVNKLMFEHRKFKEFHFRFYALIIKYEYNDLLIRPDDVKSLNVTKLEIYPSTVKTRCSRLRDYFETPTTMKNVAELLKSAGLLEGYLNRIEEKGFNVEKKLFESMA